MRDKNGTIKQYELRAFGEYALNRSYLSKMTFVFFDSNEELARALNRGRVESAYSIPSKEARRAPYSRVFGVFFNASQNEAFARLDVRHALSVAVNRTKLVEETLGGYATAIDGPVPPGLLSEEAQTLTTEYSIEEAREILLNGGWSFSEEERLWKHEKDDLSLSVTIATSNVPELRRVGEQVKADWEALGVPTTIEFHEPSTLLGNVIRPRTYDALLFGMVVGKDKDLFAFWSSSERNDPGLNIALYANRSVDALLEDIRTESDPLLVQESLDELHELIKEDYPAVFTHTPDFLYELPKDMKGVVLQTLAEPSDRFLTAPYWYRHTEYVWPALQ